MITNRSVIRAIAQGKLVLAVDSSRPASDPFKLPSALRSLLQQDLSELETSEVSAKEAKETAKETAEISPAEATAAEETSSPTREAREQLEKALRAAHAGIGAIVGKDVLPTGITDAERLAVFVTYGWEKGKLGRFSPERLLMLGELALEGENTITEPTWRYDSNLVGFIREKLDFIDASESASTLAPERADALKRLEIHLSRARFYYSAASDELDSTSELARISFAGRK